MRNLLVQYFKQAGWQTLCADTGASGIKCFETKNADLVVLDIMLPEKDGWSVCKTIRKTNKSVPIVMLTARNTDDDELFGFELGADEYITKPFNPNILVARIRAAFNKSTESKQVLSFSGLKIDVERHRVLFDGDELSLTKKEFDILTYLAKRPDVARSREQILSNVWGLNIHVNDRAVDSTIKRLRGKLHGNYLTTLRGVGYRFDAEF